jgi:hypothetical protein
MRNRLFSIALCFFAVTLVATRASAQNNTNIGELSVVAWMPSPEITLQSGSLTAATGITDIDFVQEFGIEDKTFPEFRFAVGRSHKFRFSYVPMKYEADATITRTITFRGQTFTVGAPASTDIEWDLWRFGYEWDFVSREKGYFGVVGELKYNKLNASIVSSALSVTAATEQKAPVPTIGVAGRGYPHPLVAISGELTGMKVKAGDFDGKFLDFDINAAVTLGKVIGVQGGYRAVTVDYLIDDDTGDLKMKGPYIGAVVKF